MCFLAQVPSILDLSSTSSCEALLFAALTDRQSVRTSSSGCCISSLRAPQRCDDASGACADWRSACTCSGTGGRRIFADRRTRSARVLPSCASASTSSRRRNTGEPDLRRRRDSTRSFELRRSSWARRRREPFGRRPRDFLRDGSSRKNLKKTTFVRWLARRIAKRRSHTDLPLRFYVTYAWRAPVDDRRTIW